MWRWKRQPGDCAIAPGRTCGRRREGSLPDAERGRLGVDLGGRIGPAPRGRDGLEDRWCLYLESKEKRRKLVSLEQSMLTCLASRTRD